MCGNYATEIMPVKCPKIPLIKGKKREIALKMRERLCNWGNDKI